MTRSRCDPSPQGSRSARAEDLVDGQTGVWCEALVDAASALTQTVRSAMARGNFARLSFAFTATRQAWSPEYTERIVHECRLPDGDLLEEPRDVGRAAVV